MSVRQSPMGIPANPTAAPFEVVPMMTYKKKKVARTSITKQDVRLYLPGLRSPKPLPPRNRCPATESLRPAPHCRNRQMSAKMCRRTRRQDDAAYPCFPPVRLPNLHKATRPAKHEVKQEAVPHGPTADVEAREKDKGGRPPEHNWDAVKDYALAMIREHGLPGRGNRKFPTKTQLVEDILNKWASQDLTLAETTVRRYVNRWLREL